MGRESRNPMEILFNILKEIWLVTVAMAPYLLFGFLMAGVLSVLISKDYVRRHLGGLGSNCAGIYQSRDFTGCRTHFSHHRTGHQCGHADDALANHRSQAAGRIPGGPVSLRTGGRVYHEWDEPAFVHQRLCMPFVRKSRLVQDPLRSGLDRHPRQRPAARTTQTKLLRKIG